VAVQYMVVGIFCSFDSTAPEINDLPALLSVAASNTGFKAMDISFSIGMMKLPVKQYSMSYSDMLPS
jgi:hypothetical protein